MRENITSGTVWEDVAGYSRAVKVGDHVFVSGTTATDDEGSLVGKEDAYKQASFILRKIERALVQAGSSLKDVVRTRIYLTDASLWREVSRAHKEVFDTIRPANTLLEISALVGEGYLVEIEADAIIGSGR